MASESKRPFEALSEEEAEARLAEGRREQLALRAQLQEATESLVAATEKEVKLLREVVARQGRIMATLEEHIAVLEAQVYLLRLRRG